MFNISRSFVICHNRSKTCFKQFLLGINYRPRTKLREGNVFAGVCQSFCPQGVGYSWSHVLSRGSVSLVPGPFCVGWVGTHLPDMDQRGVCTHPLPLLAPRGGHHNTVGKRSVRILLECFLVRISLLSSNMTEILWSY